MSNAAVIAELRLRIADLREDMAMLELDCLLSNETLLKAQFELSMAEVTLRKLLREGSHLSVVGGRDESAA